MSEPNFSNNTLVYRFAIKPLYNWHKAKNILMYSLYELNITMETKCEALQKVPLTGVFDALHFPKYMASVLKI